MTLCCVYLRQTAGRESENKILNCNEQKHITRQNKHNDGIKNCFLGLWTQVLWATFEVHNNDSWPPSLIHAEHYWIWWQCIPVSILHRVPHFTNLQTDFDLVPLSYQDSLESTCNQPTTYTLVGHAPRLGSHGPNSCQPCPSSLAMALTLVSHATPR